MQNPISLKAAERRVFQATFADGLWDVFIGCFVLEFALAPLLSESLGDFWSSAIFLPFWGLVYLAIRLVRKSVIAPRIGLVSFGKARRQKLRRFSLVLAGFNTLVFVLGILAILAFEGGYLKENVNLPGLFFSLFGLLLLAGFSVAAVLLDYSRLYIYGLLAFAAPPVGEWLYAKHGASHHGFPIVFGFTAGVMVLTGLFLFVRLLKNNPAVSNEVV